MADRQFRQVVVTVVFGSHAEQLDRTFTSFGQNPFLELHAFVIGERLPQRQIPKITYHLRAHDPAFSHVYRDVNYRRWSFFDELGADYALVVDGLDTLCLQTLPEIPALLKGCSIGACVEHQGGRYMFGPVYTSTYLNAGVSFWDVSKSKGVRDEIVARGRRRYRALTDDQLSFNEVIHANFDSLRILPCQFNYRAYLGRRVRGWPTCENLDGVKIYHHDECLKAKKLLPVRAEVPLPMLEPDNGPLSSRRQFWRRVQHRLKPHLVS